ncbi:DUF4314 domain-containing protein [Erysipelothrix sp. HDW6B]|uniref:DUF3846 domain-containing protein n=1 Tax=Erysipelothrix sp. HDW6B TaxID=2714929 RepID=UPI00140876B3|nr:DUF4314 domain-containing protein [Erysipelothrix sp. HDW6B]QIK86629.1 DUF4314 domain-containing protein [Erysipelothrix sp. HDW6B]
MNTKQLKERYQTGMRIECIEMNDPQSVPSGTQGTISFVDDMGTIHVSWDNGQSLGLIFGEDEFQVIQSPSKTYEKKFVNLEINTPLVRKERLDPIKNIIKTAIKVSYSDYHDLLDNPTIDRDYIIDHLDEMDQDEYGQNHSILVYCDEELDGIVIESEGYNYARYQGFATNVHDLLDTHTYTTSNYEDSYSKIKVLVIEPQTKPYVAILDNNLESLQAMVGGDLELVSLSHSAELLCNENGKMMNLPANRRLDQDLIAGRFIVVGNDGSEHFTSLSREDINQYTEQFNSLEMIDQSEVHENLHYEIQY